MVSLALETSGSLGSLALFSASPDQPFQLLASTQWEKLQSHSERVTGEIESLLKSQNLHVQSLSSFAVGIGPGSFTGVRVGINAIRALAYAFDKPVYTVDSLRIMAAQVRHDPKMPIVVLVNAYKNQVFYAAYEFQDSGLREIGGACALPIDQLESQLPDRFLAFGDGIDAYQLAQRLGSKMVVAPNLDSTFVHQSKAAELARLAHQCASPGRVLSWREVKPLYIRASSAEENLRKKI